MTQTQKAQTFKSLHRAGEPLVLYNIWDAGGAKALADAGAKASATGSWSVAAAHGFDDGEGIPLDLVLQIVERIAKSVDLPLTVDFEGGYATEPTNITQNVRQVISAGAVGINFEDQIVGGNGLHPIEQQVARIKAVRQAAIEAEIPLFINARTDVFLQPDAGDHAKLCDDALAREVAYAEAGADGFFVPGLTDLALIEEICNAAHLPVNVMMMGDLNSIEEVAALGVSRASFGPGPYFAAMDDLATNFKALGSEVVPIGVKN